MRMNKPYIYDATSHVLYIDLVFWERLSTATKVKIVDLSDGEVIPELDESFAIVIREDATLEKYQETFSPVISNVNRVCGSLYTRD